MSRHYASADSKVTSRFSRIGLNGQFLSKASRLLLSITLALCLLECLSKAWERIGCAQQFYADWGAGLWNLGDAGAITVAIGLAALCKQSARRLFAREENWKTILQHHRFFNGLRISYLLASCLTLLMLSALFSICIFDNSAKALACLLSDVGQYELAERIYQSAPDLNHNKASGRYSSMATWHSSSRREEPETLRMKNAAVAAVYGTQSLQMANRYFYLGLTCGNGPENHKPEAIYWYNKALSLYQQTHSTTKCVDAIAQMAILQDESNNQESKRLLDQATLLLPSMDEEPFVCTPIIEILAQRNGDEKQAELFRQYMTSRMQHTTDNKW